MTNLEFNKVMEAFGTIDNFIKLKNDRFYIGEDISLHYQTDYYADYADVVGKIPLEFSNIIHKKYSDVECGIRIVIPDGIESNEPNSCSVNGEYVEEYHIITKEGLIKFLIELQDYMLKKDKEYNRLLAIVTTKILDEVNPAVSLFERKNYLERIISKTYSDIPFRNLINQFDNAVNPFENNDIKLDEVEKYIDRVRIEGEYITDGKFPYKRLEIIDIFDERKKVSFYSDKEQFCYSLEYEIDKKHFLEVLHRYTPVDCPDEKVGEKISFHYFGRDLNEYIEYDMTNGTIEKWNDDVKLPVSESDILYILNGLSNYYIKYASSITIENMKKGAYCKKLNKKKIE